MFYIFISGITIILGAFSGLFSKETERTKLLIFCASVPALLSTFTGEQRDAVPIDGEASLKLESKSDFVATNSIRGSSIFIINVSS